MFCCFRGSEHQSLEKSHEASRPLILIAQEQPLKNRQCLEQEQQGQSRQSTCSFECTAAEHHERRAKLVESTSYESSTSCACTTKNTFAEFWTSKKKYVEQAMCKPERLLLDLSNFKPLGLVSGFGTVFHARWSHVSRGWGTQGWGLDVQINSPLPTSLPAYFYCCISSFSCWCRLMLQSSLLLMGIRKKAATWRRWSRMKFCFQRWETSM